MKQIIFFALMVSILILLSTANAQYTQTSPPHPVINFFFRIHTDDTVELIRLEESVGYISEIPTGDYKVRIVSADGAIINESKVDCFFLYNKQKVNGVLVNSSTHEFVDVYLSLPYSPDADSVQLYHFDNLIYQAQIPKGEPLVACGNGVCESWENSENCPQDCSAAIVTTTIPHITTTTLKIPVNGTSYNYVLIFIIVAIILLISFLIYQMFKQSVVARAR